MATISFTKQMKFNEKETKELFDFLESENKSNYKVKTPAAKKASKEILEKVFVERKK